MIEIIPNDEWKNHGKIKERTHKLKQNHPYDEHEWNNGRQSSRRMCRQDEKGWSHENLSRIDKVQQGKTTMEGYIAGALEVSTSFSFGLRVKAEGIEISRGAQRRVYNNNQTKRKTGTNVKELKDMCSTRFLEDNDN